MLIISGGSHPSLAQQVATQIKVELILANSQKFNDQEFKVQIQKNLYQEDVVIFQSTSNPVNDHLMELLLIADTAKRAGAKKIIAVMPYFGYSRQDRKSYEYGPISASLIASLIEASGIDEVITIDLHSKQSEGFFKINIQNLDAVELFAHYFKNTKNSIVVSPDVGGLDRAQKFANILGCEVALINKIRVQSGCCVMNDVNGDVTNKHCILIDDIVDTGNTLYQAVQLLRKKGAKSFDACITHSVFSKSALNKLERSGFNRVYITDTIKQNYLPDNIQIISVSKIIAEDLIRL
ncbi:MAG: ribose-phosphate pyrophosphokinase [Rickettsiales bacterium]